MKKLNLSGRYSSEVTDCHFEDIPIFLKMADLGKQNYLSSYVKVRHVVSGKILPLRSRVLRWKIVKNEHDQLVLAYRTSAEEEDYPLLYRVILNRKTHKVVLKNVTSRFSKFERLKAYYDHA